MDFMQTCLFLVITHTSLTDNTFSHARKHPPSSEADDDPSNHLSPSIFLGSDSHGSSAPEEKPKGRDGAEASGSRSALLFVLGGVLSVWRLFWMIEYLDREARCRAILRQSIMRIWIAEWLQKYEASLSSEDYSPTKPQSTSR
jgi:hypothetical protein